MQHNKFSFKEFDVLFPYLFVNGTRDVIDKSGLEQLFQYLERFVKMIMVI